MATVLSLCSIFLITQLGVVFAAGCHLKIAGSRWSAPVYVYNGSLLENRATLCRACCEEVKSTSITPVYSLDVWTNAGNFGFEIDGYNQYGNCKCGDIQRCLSPSGTSCYWYKTCLNKFSANPDATGSSNYALNYGFKYCNRYETNLRKFSRTGREWIAKTRKCLQQVLAPHIAGNYTMADLKEFAFESHTRCYVDSGVCELSPSDWLQIVSTVKDALLSEVLKTGQNVVSTGAECTARIAKAKLNDFKGTISQAIRQFKEIFDDDDDTIVG